MGGGLIRSLGGWSEVKQIGRDHMMGDERILGSRTLSMRFYLKPARSWIGDMD
jgi:hypothetical protein